MPLGKQRQVGVSTRSRDQSRDNGSSRHLSPVRTSRRDGERSTSPERRQPDAPRTPKKDDRSKSPVRHRPRGPHTPPPLKDDVKDKAVRHRPRGPHTPPPKEMDRSKSPVGYKTSGPHTLGEDLKNDRLKSLVQQRLGGQHNPPHDSVIPDSECSVSDAHQRYVKASRSPHRSCSSKSKSRERSQSPESHPSTSAKNCSKDRSKLPSKSTKLRSRDRSDSPPLHSDKSSKSKTRSHSPVSRKMDRRRDSHREKSSRDSSRTHSRYSDHERRHDDRKHERRDSRTDSRLERKRKRSGDKDAKYDSRDTRDSDRRRKEDRRHVREMSRLRDNIIKRAVDKTRQSVDRACSNTRHGSPTKTSDITTPDDHEEERLRKRHNSEMARKKSVRKAKDALNKPKSTPLKAGDDDSELSKTRQMLRAGRKMTPVKTLFESRMREKFSEESKSISKTTDSVTERSTKTCVEKGKSLSLDWTERQETRAEFEDGKAASGTEQDVCNAAKDKQRTKNIYTKITYDESSTKLDTESIVVPGSKLDMESNAVHDNNDISATTDSAKLVETSNNDHEGSPSERLQEETSISADNQEASKALPAAETTCAMQYDSGEEILDYDESDLETEDDPVGIIENPCAIDENSVSMPMEVVADSNKLPPSSQNQEIENEVSIPETDSYATTVHESGALNDKNKETSSNVDVAVSKEQHSCSIGSEVDLSGECDRSEQNNIVQSKETVDAECYQSDLLTDVSGAECKATVELDASESPQKSKLAKNAASANQPEVLHQSNDSDHGDQQVETKAPVTNERIPEQILISKPGLNDSSVVIDVIAYPSKELPSTTGQQASAKPNTPLRNSVGVDAPLCESFPEDTTASVCDQLAVDATPSEVTASGLADGKSTCLLPPVPVQGSVSVTGVSELELEESSELMTSPGVSDKSQKQHGMTESGLGNDHEEGIQTSALVTSASNDVSVLTATAEGMAEKMKNDCEETVAIRSSDEQATALDAQMNDKVAEGMTKKMENDHEETFAIQSLDEQATASDAPMNDEAFETQHIVDTPSIDQRTCNKLDYMTSTSTTSTTGRTSEKSQEFEAIVITDEDSNSTSITSKVERTSEKQQAIVITDEDSNSLSNVLTSTSGCTVEYIDYCIDKAEKLRTTSASPKEVAGEKETGESSKMVRKRKRSSSVQQDVPAVIHNKKLRKDTSDQNGAMQEIAVENIAKEIQDNVATNLPGDKDLGLTTVFKDGAKTLSTVSSVTGVSPGIATKSMDNEVTRMKHLEVDDVHERTDSPPLTYEFSSHFMETIDTPMTECKHKSVVSPGSQGDSDRQSESFNSSGTSGNGTGDLSRISDGIDNLIQHTGDMEWNGSASCSQQEMERLEATAERALGMIFASRFTQRIQRMKESKKRVRRKRRKILDTHEHQDAVNPDSCRDIRQQDAIACDAELGSSKNIPQQSELLPADENIKDIGADQSETKQVTVESAVQVQEHILRMDDTSSSKITELIDPHPSSAGDCTIASSDSSNNHGVENNEPVDQIMSSTAYQETSSNADYSHQSQPQESTTVTESVPEQLSGNLDLSSDAILCKESPPRQDLGISPDAVIFREPPGREEEVASCTPPPATEEGFGTVGDFMELHPNDTSLIDDVFHEEVATVDTDVANQGSANVVTSTPKEKSSQAETSKGTSGAKETTRPSKVTRARSDKTSSKSNNKPESKTYSKRPTSSRSDKLRSRSHASSASSESKDERNRQRIVHGSSAAVSSRRDRDSKSDENDRKRSSKTMSSDGEPDQRISRNDGKYGNRSHHDRAKDRSPDKGRQSRRIPPRPSRRGEGKSERDRKDSHERTPSSGKEDIRDILRSVSVQIGTKKDVHPTPKSKSSTGRVRTSPFQKVERNKLGPFGHLTGGNEAQADPKDNSAPSRVGTTKVISRKRPLDDSLSEGEIVSDDESDTEQVTLQRNTRDHAASDRNVSKQAVVSRNSGRTQPVRQSPRRHKLMVDRDRSRNGVKKRDRSGSAQQQTMRRNTRR